MKVYSLFGQSNMVGRGPGTPPSYANAARIRCYPQPWDTALAIPVNLANLGAGAWGAASDPLHSSPLCTVGPGMSFANRMADHIGPGYDIGLVPCARTGAGLKGSWEPNYRNTRPYSSGIMRSNAARDYAEYGKLSGVVFYAGETDAQAADASYWITLLASTIAIMRCDLGDLELPFVVVVPANITVGGYPSISNIQQWTRDMAGCSPRLGVVDASDLATFEGLHLTQDSAVTLGIRIADMMITL